MAVTKKYIVITTINPEDKVIKSFKEKNDWHIVVVGDKKSAPITSSERLTFLSFEDQQKLGFSFVDKCPENHYCRKNIGYLYALKQGAEIIYETDDDTYPNDSWKELPFSCDNKCDSNSTFVNVFNYFTDKKIWPRGFPLDEIKSNAPPLSPSDSLNIGVWSGLVDQDPDVDAIHRMIFGDDITLREVFPFFLGKSTYCSFNSQNTFWNPKAFAGLYLPCTVSFRFTDILRGYIVQRLLWEKDLHLGFFGPWTYQIRNDHDLMKDFREEIDCYTKIKDIVNLLDNHSLGDNMLANHKSIYHELSKHNIVSKEELDIFTLWMHDFEQIMKTREKI